MNKKIQSKYFNEQVNICKEAGLISITSLVIGYPDETRETISETMLKLEKLGVYPSTGFLLPLPETGMWKYAIENNFIKDIDHYLTQITERQDFSLNLTKMKEKDLKNETIKWLKRLNKNFENNLKNESLLKTGGYNRHSKNQVKDRVKSSTNTRETLNYATYT